MNANLNPTRFNQNMMCGVPSPKCQVQKHQSHQPTLLLTLAVLALSLAATVAQPTAIAHWSFDADTLSIDDGSITNVADATGNRDAYVTPNGVGPNSRISAAFPVADSVAGKFGEALRFNGDNFLVFSNLTELMQANGNPSYSISMWVRWLNASPPVGNTVFRTMSDWGNQTPGVPNVSTDHAYGFGPNGATTIRAQTRRPSGGTGGADIYARTTPNTSVTDGDWHMLTWTFDTTIGQLSVYFDGVFVENFNASSPYTMADSVSPIGTFGLKADDGAAPFLEADTQLDEVWVFVGLLSADDVAQLHEINAIIEEGINVTWAGGENGNWNTATANWRTNGGPATIFAHGDLALFDDSSSVNNINATTHLLPWRVTVNNDTRAYTFTGTGRLTTSAEGLVKQGPGTLTLANSGNNAFTQVAISGGVLQVGDGGNAGNLGSANVLNDASLVFNRTGNLTVGGNITGPGTLTQSGAGTVTLNGENTYTGKTSVTGGTLALGTAATLSDSTEVAVVNGAFDVVAAVPLVLGGNLSLTNAALTVALAEGTDAVTTPALSADGANTIHVNAMPDVLTYPRQFTAIKYTTLNAGVPIYLLGSLPPTLSTPYAGVVSNRVTLGTVLSLPPKAHPSGDCAGLHPKRRGYAIPLWSRTGRSV